MGHKKEMG